jgi:diguanylate cyclase (GGDEF)-like protein
MNLRSVSPRALTVSYVVALVAIAGLSIFSHLLLESGLRSDEGTAAIVNQAGRQRMLSQRIAALAAELRLGDESARAPLQAAIATFATANTALASASRSSALSSDGSRTLQALYFDGPDALDPRVRRFVADARRIADSPIDDPALPAIQTRLFAEAREPLLTALNEVVTIEQAESERRIVRLESLQWGIVATVLLTLIVEALVIFRPMIRRIAAYTAELLHLASTDMLTGAANRRNFMERCEAEVSRARRYNRPTSILMLDADRFKSINDTYGHAAGDEVLKAIAAGFRQNLRDPDIWGRLGGEEFAILLVETPLSEATVVAERLRLQLAATTVTYNGQPIHFTVSIGVAALAMEDDGLERALSRADALMYQAKNAGRNRVVAENAPSGTDRAPPWSAPYAKPAPISL